MFGHLFGNHLIGGDISYQFIADNDFEITLNVYRDGLSGGAAFDDPAIISIINRDNNRITYKKVYLIKSLQIPSNDLGPCANNPPQLKEELGIYKLKITLSTNINGYSIIYQRCCRNDNILNLLNPETQGGTLETFISPKAILEHNSQPQFVNLPPALVCLNQEFTFDHSAIDKDGDSLVYQFCAPFKGLSQDQPAVDPDYGYYATRPPYQNVTYKSPYSFSNPFNITPAPILNSTTGQMDFTPTVQGKFIVGVCVSEYRDGELLSKYIRDVQFTALDCNLTYAQAFVPNAAIASIIDSSQLPYLPIKVFTYCQGAAVKFENKSTGNKTNNWDFGDLTSTNDTSSLSTPSYFYKDTGDYTVTLIINKGLRCSDTSKIKVSIRPSISIGFMASSVCTNSEINFTDTSSTQPNDISGWLWDFGDGNTSNIQNPKNTYLNPGNFPIQLTVSTKEGCKNSYTKNLEIFSKPESAVIDGSSCMGIPFTLIKTSTIDTGFVNEFEWFVNNLSFSNDSIPTITFTERGQQVITLITTTNKGCKDTANGIITVGDSLFSNFSVGKTPYCSGQPIEFINESIGLIDSYDWDFGDGYTSTEKDPKHIYLFGNEYNVSLKVKNNLCGNYIMGKPVEVIQTPFLNLPVQITACYGDFLPITVFDSVGALFFWSNGANGPIAFVDASLSSITVEAIRDGCVSIDSVKIIPDCAVFFPTIFSPNGDNINDNFNIITQNVKKYSLTIYNRWGEKLFETNQLNYGWDGTFKGENQMIDEYLYFCEGVLASGQSFKKTGVFTLFR